MAPLPVELGPTWRILLGALGVLFGAQGLGKALDPAGYMVALDRFRVVAPVTWSPVPMATLALAWTALELAAGAILIASAASRPVPPRTTLSGLGLAVGFAAAYLSLEIGAWARGLPIDNVTWFGGRGPHLAPWVVLVGAIVVVALAAEARRVVHVARRGAAGSVWGLRGNASEA